MKKQFTSLICLILGVSIGIGGCVVGSLIRDSGKRRNLPRSTPVSSGDISEKELTSLAYDVLGCIRGSDYETLSTYVHPLYGLVFTPYSTVSLNTNQCFTPNRVSIIGEDGTIYVWGTKYGTGEPIQLTASQFFSSYLYGRDYFRAPIIGVNRVVKNGNLRENVETVFPDGRYVDFVFPGTEADGSGWSCLRLVFEPYEGVLKLSALIHSEYTE